MQPEHLTDPADVPYVAPSKTRGIALVKGSDQTINGSFGTLN